MPNALLNRPTPLHNAYSRAMYVWGQEALTTDAAQQQLIDFCSQNGVTVLFLNTWLHLSRPHWTQTKVVQMRSFLDAAHRSGIQVHALVGDLGYGQAHEWVMLNIVEPIVAFNLMAAKPTERIDGFHFDIEYWQDAVKYPPGIHLPGICDLVKAIKTRARIPVSLFAGFFLMGTGRPMVSYDGKVADEGEHLVDVCDYLVIGSYRDTAQAQGDIFAPWYAYASQKGKNAGLYIGTETIQVDPPSITFFGATKATMEGQHAIVSRRFTTNQNSVFLGIAVHDYNGWRALR